MEHKAQFLDTEEGRDYIDRLKYRFGHDVIVEYDGNYLSVTFLGFKETKFRPCLLNRKVKTTINSLLQRCIRRLLHHVKIQ